ncbi:hypothetical protein LBMAG52_08760 [Planctomycetia bacterium]|nr:hypothetical protein LBMAG52_08760 [Planctomycetia bacterium]
MIKHTLTILAALLLAPLVVLHADEHLIHPDENPQDVIHDNTGKPVVVLGAPGGWEQPQPPTMKNNRNHLGEATSK